MSDRLSPARRAIRVLSRFKVFRLSLIGNQEKRMDALFDLREAFGWVWSSNETS